MISEQSEWLFIRSEQKEKSHRKIREIDTKRMKYHHQHHKLLTYFPQFFRCRIYEAIIAHRMEFIVSLVSIDAKRNIIKVEY